MTDYPAKIKHLRWKAANTADEYLKGYYSRYADRLQKQYDKILKEREN